MSPQGPKHKQISECNNSIGKEPQLPYSTSMSTSSTVQLSHQVVSCQKHHFHAAMCVFHRIPIITLLMQMIYW